MKTKRNRPRIYKKLTEDILLRIAEGVYSSRLPGIDTLADEFKVNRKTINKSINQLISAGNLVRIHGRGTFITGRIGKIEEKGLRRKNSRRYAFLLRVEDSYTGYMDLIAGLEEEISKISGCIVFIKFDERCPEKLLGSLRHNKIEGVIVCGLIDDKLLEALKQEFSILLVDYSSSMIPVNSIVWEAYESGLKLGEKLLQRGVKEFYQLNPMVEVGGKYLPRPLQYVKRMVGITSVLESNGVKIFKYDTDWKLSNMSRGHELASRLRKGSDKKAFFCDCPIFALSKLGCIALATRLIITGLCDRRTADNSLPGIYVCHDMFEMGREAGRCIIDIIGRPSTRVRVITLIPKVVEIGVY